MVIYTDSVRFITANLLHGFFEGWPNPPSPEAHLRIIQRSSHIVLARIPHGPAVGFVTAISDGVLSAYVPLLEVLPLHRRQGIGTDLMRRLLQKLEGLYSVNLHCDPRLRPFYEALGMQVLGGMVIRNYAAQSGEHAA
jgi:GNAT superfamily N-acetyltransferase